MCVLGWLELPETADSAVRLVFNPEGEGGVCLLLEGCVCTCPYEDMNVPTLPSPLHTLFPLSTYSLPLHTPSLPLSTIPPPPPPGTDVRSRPRVWWHPGTPQKLWLVVVGRLQVNLALDASKDSSDGDDVIPMQGQWGGGNGGGMGGGTGGMGMPVGEEAQYRSAMFGVLNHSNVAWGKQQQGGTGNEA